MGEWKRVVERDVFAPAEHHPATESDPHACWSYNDDTIHLYHVADAGVGSSDKLRVVIERYEEAPQDWHTRFMERTDALIKNLGGLSGLTGKFTAEDLAEKLPLLDKGAEYNVVIEKAERECCKKWHRETGFSAETSKRILYGNGKATLISFCPECGRSLR